MAAIPNKIVIGNDQDNPIVTFENPEIISIDTDTSVSLIGEELYVDQFTSTVDYFVWEPYVINPADKPGTEYGPYSGDIVTFEADRAGYVSEGEIGINPVQNLNGYANPWPPGGGKNKTPTQTIQLTTNTYTTLTVDDAGTESRDWVLSFDVSNVNVTTASASWFRFFDGGTSTDKLPTSFREVGSNTYWSNLTKPYTGRLYITYTGRLSSIRCFYESASYGKWSGGDITNVQLEVGTAPSSFAPYSNVCPITGWIGANIVVSPTEDAQGGTTYPVSWQTEAGTVYGGTLDLETGVLTVTDIMAVVDGTLNTVVTEQSYNGTQGVFTIGVPNFPHVTKGNADKFGTICNRFKEETFNHTVTAGYDNVFALQGNYSRNIVFRKTDLTSKTAWIDWLSVNPVQVVYKLATPFTVQLTAPPPIQTLVGTNYIWSNTGSITDLMVTVPTDNYDAFVSSDGYILCSKKNYDIRLLPYGTKITYYAGGDIAGVFYVKNVERVQRAWYKLHAISAIGLLDKQYHKGGIYTGQYLQDVIEDIIGVDYDYIIDGLVAVQTVYGWLPYDTRRNNLYQVLFAYGVEVTVGDNGAMFFSFPEETATTMIPADRVFTGGKIIYDEPASRVEINEHSYHYDPDNEEQVLFDNSSDAAVTDTMVIFDEPIYPSSIYCASGSLTIGSTHANYAIISGVGVLKGIPYVHNARLLTQENESAPTEKVVSVQDATLVSFVTADNVLARLSEYYFNARRVEQDIKVETEKPGRLYTTEDPYNQLMTGYISRMTKSVTSFARATCRFICNYIPTGSGQAFTNRVVIPLGSGASETWTIPASVFEKETPSIRVTLIGKGADGEDGQDGEPGQSGIDRAGFGGAGGLGGAGGSGGNIFTATILATGLTEITLANDNTESTLSSQYYAYSSADGAPSRFGYFDILTQEVFAHPGTDGVAGGAGGRGDYYTHSRAGEATMTDGESVEYSGVTYTGGAFSGRNVTNGRPVFPNSQYSGNLTLYTGGAGGGGAAVGNNGGNAFAANNRPAQDWWEWGSGGDGADAVDAGLPANAYGNGGNGGHGGGGGGAGGNYESWNHVYSSVIATGGKPSGAGGKGGHGSAGNYGCAIIYY